MIKNFNHVCVIVKNLNRSLKFYRDILGFKVSKITELEGDCPETLLNKRNLKLTYVKLRAPGQPKKSPPVFELHCWKTPRISPKKSYNHISFTVGNIDYMYKKLRKQRIKFISKPIKVAHGYSKICFGYDPDGNLIEFTQILKKK